MFEELGQIPSHCRGATINSLDDLPVGHEKVSGPKSPNFPMLESIVLAEWSFTGNSASR
jgi:hypothetical protein